MEAIEALSQVGYVVAQHSYRVLPGAIEIAPPEGRSTL